MKTKPSVGIALMYLLYLLPSGIWGFTWLLVGLVLSIASMPIFIGFPLLLFTLRAAKTSTALDARFARKLLQLETPGGGPESLRPPFAQVLARRGLFAQLGEELAEPQTYISLLWQAARLPIGITAFSAAVVLSALELGLLASPIVHAVLLRTIGIDIFEHQLLWLWVSQHLETWQLALIYFGVGLLLLPAMIRAIRSIALFFGRIAADMEQPAAHRNDLAH